MIYAMSDIHGCAEALKERLRQISFHPDDHLIFLGDYIDYGPDSGAVLRTIFQLQEEKGTDVIIALKGNHEDMFLSWLKEYKTHHREDFFTEHDWLRSDSDAGLRTFKTLVKQEQWDGAPSRRHWKTVR